MSEGKKEIFTFKYDDDKPAEDTIDIEVGEIKVIKDKEICLTCSGVRRMVWAEMEGNHKVIKKACLYCLTRIHTENNRNDP